MPDNQIILHVDNNSICIEGRFNRGLYKKFKKALGYRPEDALFMMKQSEKKSQKEGRKWVWDGYVSTVCYNRHYCKCPVKKDGTHFPAGLYGRARAFFDDHNVNYRFIDDRQSVSASLDLSMSAEFEQRFYQRDIVEKAVRAQRGIVRAATGSGKTAIAAELISELGVSPFIFYVPSIDLLTQARDELSRFIRHQGSPLQVGTIGAGTCDIQDVNVMTVQTAVRALGEKYIQYDDEDQDDKEVNFELESRRADIKDLIMSSKGCICDEVQHWAAETCQIISDYSLSSYYKYGFSATPWRDKGDDLLIDACFGRQIANISASFLIQHGYLVKPNIYFVPISHSRYKLSAYQSIYERGIVNNPDRNGCIASVAKKFAGEGRVVLILCRYVSHGQMLNELIEDSVFLYGKHSGKQREDHLNRMRNREASVTIATSIFDEGIDCRPLDTLILAGSGKSQTRALQRVGRTLRPYDGKTHAVVVDFFDKCKYLRAHSKKRRKMYETEPEFDIEDIELE